MRSFAPMLQVGIAAGWGITETGEVPDRLRYVELNIVPNVTCVANVGKQILYCLQCTHYTAKIICIVTSKLSN